LSQISSGNGGRQLSIDLNAEFDPANVFGQLPQNGSETVGLSMLVGVYRRRKEIFAVCVRVEASAMDHVAEGTGVYGVCCQSDRILDWKISSHLKFLVCRSPSFRVSCDVHH
jgi:hypothetical protein